MTDQLVGWYKHKMFGLDFIDFLATAALVAGLAFVVSRLMGWSVYGRERFWDRKINGARMTDTTTVSGGEGTSSFLMGSDADSGSSSSGYSPLHRSPTDMIIESYAGYGAEDVFGRSNNLHGS